MTALQGNTIKMILLSASGGLLYCLTVDLGFFWIVGTKPLALCIGLTPMAMTISFFLCKLLMGVWERYRPPKQPSSILPYPPTLIADTIVPYTTWSRQYTPPWSVQPPNPFSIQGPTTPKHSFCFLVEGEIPS
jgi:hypothetical protein